MGVLYTLVIGELESVRQQVDSNQLWNAPEVFAAKYLSHHALADLFSILIGRPFDVEGWLDQAVDEYDGFVIYTMIPADCVTLLARLPSDQYGSIAAQWGAAEQLNWDLNFPPLRPLNWLQKWVPYYVAQWEARQAERATENAELVLDYLQATCQLAAKAESSQQPLCLVCTV